MFNRFQAYFALTRGVHSREDIGKAIMAGSNAVMIASELVQKGIPRAKLLLSKFSQ